MAEKESGACGAAVAEARRVVEQSTYGGARQMTLLARYVLAADAALGAWERWVSLRASGLSMTSTLTEYDDAVRLTAEARGDQR